MNIKNLLECNISQDYFLIILGCLEYQTREYKVRNKLHQENHFDPSKWTLMSTQVNTAILVAFTIISHSRKSPSKFTMGIMKSNNFSFQLH